MANVTQHLLGTSTGGVVKRLNTLILAQFPLTLAVYAFGSQVQGNANDQSDLDLAVLVAGYAEPLALWDAAVLNVHPSRVETYRLKPQR